MSGLGKKIQSQKGSVALHFALIAVLGLLAYSNTFNVPFVFDDNRHIIENPIIKDLKHFIHPSEAEEIEILDLHSALTKRYMGYLSFALNYRFHGLIVKGYHITNLLIHIINGLLVYCLVVLTFKTPFLSLQGGGRLRSSRAALGTSQSRPSVARNDLNKYIALFSALLFVAHPVQTQAVTYVVQRLASMATMFYLLSLVSYAGSRLSSGKMKRYSLYGLSIGSAFIAMNTKQIAFTLPVVITLYEFSFFREGLKRRTLFIIPFLLIMLIIPMTYIDEGKLLEDFKIDISHVPVGQEISRHDYMLTEIRVLVTYLRLLVLPINQNLDYDYPVSHSFFEPKVFLSFMFLLGIFSFGIYLFHRSRIADHALRFIAFGIFWFFITLSVESSIIPLHPLYEHRLYLPSVGIFGALGTRVFLLFETQRSKAVRTVFITLLVIVIMILSIASYARNNVWQSEISLWEDAVRKSPNKARVNYILGKAYQEARLFDKAIEYNQIAVELKPDYAEAHNNLGMLYVAKGLTNKAVEHYKLALRAMPDYPKPHYNLGHVYLNKGFIEKARKEFELALRANPNYHRARKWINHIDNMEKINR